jgi:hypothetical protein
MEDREDAVLRMCRVGHLKKYVITPAVSGQIEI